MRFKDLLGKRSRLFVNGSDIETIRLRLETTTYVLGGGPRLRDVDRHDIIRGASIRGQLRFWWRALYAETHENLAQAERERFGGVHGKDSGENGENSIRSPIEVRVAIITQSNPERFELGIANPRSYALFAARMTKEEEPAFVYKAGIKFELVVVVPTRWANEIRHALRAWILFGGYGARTRRGAGSLTVVIEPSINPYDWLPKSIDDKINGGVLFGQLAGLLGQDAFTRNPNRRYGETPVLQGAQLMVGTPEKNGDAAWAVAIGWLKDFRQKDAQDRSRLNHAADSEYARTNGKPSGRTGWQPGWSNWPEPDKARRLLKPEGPWGHGSALPRHNNTPVWPRAAFGLPIVCRFKDWQDGANGPSGQDYTITWKKNDSDETVDRLASPLIVKAMPLADGRFVPIALWLNRDFPPDSKVVLTRKEGGEVVVVSGSEADFNELVASNDTAYFDPLRAHAAVPSPVRLREAFFAWLDGQGAKRVV